MSKKNSEAPRFKKEQFIGSERYTEVQKDIISALLDKENTYTREEVDNILLDFSRKEFS
ncbi:hypothetical protein NW801_13760 [Brevibacillus laterosporus]|uniref:Fur-regulated basic protein FbpA n=1 Tax=Brevibacillus halotolerans TaxID=1507437 RepID=A0ABT4HYE7_9BACL|nr:MULTISPECIES: hypothetical protein [Brevibacillus]MCR8986090.1 hypothetical protein [Brevibacillus laterosporus]MCZ0831823.1 hypothetical protein [Brevibacillus halotolerans]